MIIEHGSELSTAVRATLAEIARLDELDDDDGFFSRLAEAVARLVRAGKLTFGVAEGSVMRARAAYGLPGETAAMLSHPLDFENPGLAESLMAKEDFAFRADLRGTEALDRYGEVLQAMQVENAIAVGWRAGTTVLGTVAAYDSRRPEGFTDGDLTVLRVAADTSALIYRQRIQRRRLRSTLAFTAELSRLVHFPAMAEAAVRHLSEMLPAYQVAVVEIPRHRPHVISSVAVSMPVDGLPAETALERTGVGKAILEGRPVETADLAAVSQLEPVLTAVGVRWFRAQPLLPARPLSDGRPGLGGLVFVSTTAQTVSVEDRAFMDDVARRLAAHAERAELLAAERETVDAYRKGLQEALDLGSTAEPQQVIQALLERAALALGAERATLTSIAGDGVVIEGCYDVDGLGYAIGQRFAGTSPEYREVVESGAIRLESYSMEKVPEGARPSMAEIRHSITVPIQQEGKVVATLAVSRRRDLPFNQREASLVEALTASAAVAWRNAGLYAEVRDSRRSLRLALEAAEAVAAATTYDDLIATLLESARATAGADSAAFCVLEDRGLLIQRTTHGLGVGLRWPLSPEVEAALIERRPVQTSSVRERAPSPELQEAIHGADWALTVPLLLEGQLEGVLSLGRAHRNFSEAEIDAVRRLAPVAALLQRNSRLLAEARAASQSKSDFLNMAAHELRTPLSVIRGYLSLASDGTLGPVPDQLATVLKVLNAKAQELGALVDNLLVAARVQNVVPQAPVEPVDLVEQAGAGLDRAGARGALMGATLATDFPDRPVHVLANPEHVARILDNLVNNAITYSVGEASVRIAVTVTDRAELRVSDRGRGISAERWEQIFEQFTRVEDHEAGYPAGTGLGLYIARRLAEAHGGTLAVESSAVGRGSTFLLTLPLA